MARKLTKKALAALMRARNTVLTAEERSDIARTAALARAAKLSPERRREIATAASKLGVEARWGKGRRTKRTAA